MKDSLKDLGVRLDEALIKIPAAIRVAERYHAPLRKAYKRNREDTGKGTSDQDCL